VIEAGALTRLRTCAYGGGDEVEATAASGSGKTDMAAPDGGVLDMSHETRALSSDCGEFGEVHGRAASDADDPGRVSLFDEKRGGAYGPGVCGLMHRNDEGVARQGGRD
jgi:hypothetical protein